MIRYSGLFLITMFILAGCSKYTRDIFWENKIKPTPYVAADATVKPQLWDNERITYAWLGHATVLLNFNGTLILTDPVLHERIGPPEIFNNVFGIKRLIQLPIKIDDMPVLDLVLVSHPHFDHLDLASLNSLQDMNDFKLIVPALSKQLLDDELADAIELDWMDRTDKSVRIDNLTVTAFRVEHYGYADWADRDVKRGFNGYLISSGNHHVAFFGDTSYSRYRDETGDVLTKPLSIDWKSKFPAQVLHAGIDLCIIPIGDSTYYWNHIGPDNAVRLAKQLNCKKMLPIHYATFLLTPPEDEITRPKEQLINILRKEDAMELVRCTTVAEQVMFPGVGVSCVSNSN